MRFTILAVLQASFWVMAGFTAHGTQTTTYGIHVVPAPALVTIDGKLDDWDLSGQVLMCYDVENLRDIYSANVAAMYDTDNLYVAIHWVSPMPMSNTHDPHYQAARGWAGDCVQLRIKTDEIVHLTSWYYAPKHEPAAALDYGASVTEPFGGPSKVLFQANGWKLDEGMEAAFVTDPDGKGYVQEIKVPWRLITKDKKYVGGDSFNMGVELLWGAGDWPVHRYADNMNPGYSSREFFFTNVPAWGPMFLEPHGHLHLPPPAWQVTMERKNAQGPVNVSYDLPEKARVTLAIDDANGKRVRNLISGMLREAGKNTEHWDGLDDNGLAVTPGTYRYKVLYQQGIHVSYVTSFANPGRPTWDTPDGTGAFYADHSAPHAAAAGGGNVALGCPIGEAGQALIGCDLSGQRLWGLNNFPAAVIMGRMALATDGTTLWAGADRSGSIARCDLATGKFAPWKKMTKDPKGREFPMLNLSVFDPSTLPKDDDYGMTDPNMRALAVNDTLIAVALKRDGTVKLYDKETGDPKGEIKLAEPKALVFNRDGSLIVLAKDQLLRVTVDGKSSPFATGSFPDGYGLARDAQRNVYLSVRGADQNVKRFSPDGTLTAEIGKHGGRPDVGAFDPSGMRNPAGIAVDGQNRLWVTEETMNPKRTSVWDTKTGQLLLDLPGTTEYSSAAAINPLDPTMAFTDDTVYQIDLDKGAWKPVYSLGKNPSPDAIFPMHVDCRALVVRHGSDTYAYTSDYTGEASCIMLRDGVWQPVSCVGIEPADGKPVNGINYAHPLLASHRGEAFAWVDKNGDGLVQADELQFAPGTFHGAGWGGSPFPDGTLAYLTTGDKSFVKFPIQSYNGCGAPVYDLTKSQTIALDVPAGSPSDGYTWRGGSDGKFYLLGAPLSVYDATGHVLGTFPNRFSGVHGSHDAPSAQPNLLIGPLSFAGIVQMGGDIGDIFSINGNLGENYLYTSDGLLIQKLFQDTRGHFDVPTQAIRGMPMDGITGGGEDFGANFIRTASGKVYLTIGSTDARVLEVRGLETIKRLEGSFTYSPDQYLAAQSFDEKKAVDSQTEAKTYTIPKASGPMQVEASPSAWPELSDDGKPLIEVEENAQTRFGRIASRYDDQNLYLAYRVFSPNQQMRNAGQDFHLLFKTGDAVDLMMGPEAQKPGGQGNLRLLIAPLGGQPTAVLYEQKVPDTSEKDRTPFSSPWRTFYFDRVTQSPEAKVATGPFPGGGYFVQAAIPWSLLGITPSAGLKLKADFGILSADSGGTITASRKYWSNQSTGLVNDIPGEAELEPQQWGEVTLQ